VEGGQIWSNALAALGFTHHEEASRPGNLGYPGGFTWATVARLGKASINRRALSRSWGGKKEPGGAGLEVGGRRAAAWQAAGGR
jgi:hypothetical protein